jgi:VanZ family protein
MMRSATTMLWLRRAIWIGTALYWLAAFILTHTPSAIPLPGVQSDKTGHLIGYFVLGTFLYASLRAAGWRHAVLWVLVIGMIYGAIDEQSQRLVNRSCELQDWCADAAGLALAAAAAGLVTLWRERRSNRASW